MDKLSKYKANFSNILILVLAFFISSCACEFNSTEAIFATKSSFQKKPLPPLFIVNGDSDNNTAGGLQSIYYDYKKSKPDELQLRFLDENIRILASHPEVSIVIEAHCDSVGGIYFNDKLALERGMFLKSYLVSKGVALERMSINSIGSQTNANIKDNLDNKERRVNFIISSLIPVIPTVPVHNSIASSMKQIITSEKKQEAPIEILHSDPYKNTSIKGIIANTIEALTDISTTVTPLRAPAKLLLNGESDLLTAGELQSLFFEYKKHNIEKDQRAILDSNIIFLKANPTISLALEVHCDPVGGETYNLKLENKRLNFIINYLALHGITANRISKKIIGPKPASESKKIDQIDHSKQFFKTERRVNFIITTMH